MSCTVSRVSSGLRKELLVNDLLWFWYRTGLFQSGYKTSRTGKYKIQKTKIVAARVSEGEKLGVTANRPWVLYHLFCSFGFCLREPRQVVLRVYTEILPDRLGEPYSYEVQGMELKLV